MINVYDDFSKLNEVILGDVNTYLLDTVDMKYRQQIEDIFLQTKDDLNSIQTTLEGKGVKVHRPNIKKEFAKTITTPTWNEHGIRNCLSYLTNIEPIMDTAQLARFGSRLLVSTRGAGNRLGTEWIARTFENFEVVRMDSCFSGHLDAQIKIIRPGLMISPYAREKHPDFMQKWDIIPTKIYNTAPEIIDDRFQDDDWDNTYFQTSMLSYDENTVFVFEHYKKLFPMFIKDMESKGVECVFIPFRHQHWFSQGSTCLTCDINRSGGMEVYD